MKVPSGLSSFRSIRPKWNFRPVWKSIKNAYNHNFFSDRSEKTIHSIVFYISYCKYFSNRFEISDRSEFHFGLCNVDNFSNRFEFQTGLSFLSGTCNHPLKEIFLISKVISFYSTRLFELSRFIVRSLSFG